GPELNRGIEQALIRGEERAAAVDVDAPALEHHACGHQRQLEPRSHTFRDAVVLFPVGILGPRVEAEPRDRHVGPRARPAHEQGSEVARPAAIGRKPEELDPAEGYAGPLEDAARLALVGARAHENPHALSGRQLADALAVDPAERPQPPG